MSNPCLSLVPGFKALDAMKSVNAVCETFGSTVVSGQYTCQDVEITVDYFALCQLVCCCDKNGKSSCMREVLGAANANGNSHFKPEVPYYDDNGNKRTPDVTVLKDPKGPIRRDNIHQIYEIKFTKDRYRSTVGADEYKQLDAYKSGDYFPKEKFNTMPLDPQACRCKDGKTQGIPVLDQAVDWENAARRDAMWDELRRLFPSPSNAPGPVWGPSPGHGGRGGRGGIIVIP